MDSAFRWRFVLLALMRYAACPSFETPRSFKIHSANTLQARSFIFTRPVQTLVGKLVVAAAYAATVSGRADNLPVESTAHAIRASLLATATINTFLGARISSAVNHAPIATLLLASWSQTAGSALALSTIEQSRAAVLSKIPGCPRHRRPSLSSQTSHQ